jgi:hypothetical protein
VRQQLRPGRPVDGPIDAATTEERGVGRVHDRVDSQRRDVGLEGAQSHESEVTPLQFGTRFAKITGV